ncbi:MAG: phosphoribosylanthranilate isomerase [Pseudomonadota bacterium]|nr:phosphoribosylanthranilate isomerase [Pseudomonadota bacterium]
MLARSTRIKICGITRYEDATAAAAAGADAIGFVFYRNSPRFVDPDRAKAIAVAIPPFVSTVGLFVDADAADVEASLRTFRVDYLQFHGDENREYCSQFGVPFLKAVRVRPGLDLLHYAADFSAARALLLDAFVDGVPGGTGQRFDWNLIPRNLPVPIVLSGGLSPDNITEAVRKVRPWAVDVSSGVEAAKGIKDGDKIKQFIRGVRNADV